MRGNSHARCGVGENSEITSKNYLSLSEGLMECGCEVVIVGTSDKVFETADEFKKKRVFPVMV